MGVAVSMAEIKAQFGSEWILIKDPDLTVSLEVKSGTVLWHSKSRDEVYRKAEELCLHPRRSAIMYVEMPPKVE